MQILSSLHLSKGNSCRGKGDLNGDAPGPLGDDRGHPPLGLHPYKEHMLCNAKVIRWGKITQHPLEMVDETK